LASAVLLDFDGTLTASKPGILASYAAAIRALGHEPDPAVDLTYVVGPAIRDVIGHVLAHYGDDRADAAVEAYRAHYRSVGRLDSVLYPGVSSLLEALQAAGRRVFLATAKRTDISRTMLERFGLLHLFAGVYGSEPGGALDHKPELIAHILAREALDPAHAVMVGDRSYDIAGAHANGVRAIGALWGYGGRAELEQAGADDLAESPADLAAMLLHSGA
jgi:phosphoglycolate phosphatase